MREHVQRMLVPKTDVNRDHSGLSPPLATRMLACRHQHSIHPIINQPHEQHSNAMRSKRRKAPKNRLTAGLFALLSHSRCSTCTGWSKVDAFCATGPMIQSRRLLSSPHSSSLISKASQDAAVAATDGDIASAASYRVYCPRCHRPSPTCICHALPADGPISLPNIRVLILQHPREARKRKRTGTVPLVRLCLEDVTVCVGTAFGCGKDGENKSSPQAFREVLDRQEEEGAMLLYPGDSALPLTAASIGEVRPTNTEGDGRSTPPNNITLIVLDGTWAQTQSMYQQSPALHRLPTYMFADDRTSLFDPMRQEPAGHCTSTLEAISRSLRIIAGDKDDDDNAAILAADALEGSLRAMVEGQMRYANDASKSRPRTKNMRDGDTVDVARGKTEPQGRKIRRRRQAQLSLSKPLSEEEIEARRIRFIYVAHLG